MATGTRLTFSWFTTAMPVATTKQPIAKLSKTAPTRLPWFGWLIRVAHPRSRDRAQAEISGHEVFRSHWQSLQRITRAQQAALPENVPSPAHIECRLYNRRTLSTVRLRASPPADYLTRSAVPRLPSRAEA